jgi:MFS family permease
MMGLVKLEPYRRVLALPGVRSLMLLALVARIPLTAVAVTMTLHVVTDMHRGYGAAGLIGAASTVGAALGAPLNGRLVDRRGLRPMLMLTTVAEGLFWPFASYMSYPVLLVAAFVGGILALPVFSVVRQSVAALVPADQRRQAYALDSMSTEISFMAGPTLAVLVVTGTSARVAMIGIGVLMVLAGVALFALNPPVREDEEQAPDPDRPAPPRRTSMFSVLNPKFLAILAATTVTTMVLSGTDVSVVSLLRAADQVSWTGAVLTGWAVYSLIGGFVYGAVTRTPRLVVLVGLLGLFTIPVGLVGGHWWLLFLTILPAGALCAPTLSASADAVSQIVPARVRGEAMGWHGSALTTGLALGSPIAGAAIDAGSPPWGFAVIGVAGVVVTAILIPFSRRSRAEAAGTADETADGAAQSVVSAGTNV